MKSVLTVLALLATAHADTASDTAAIRAQTVTWMKAYNTADAKTMTALYTDDALLMPPEIATRANVGRSGSAAPARA